MNRGYSKILDLELSPKALKRSGNLRVTGFGRALDEWVIIGYFLWRIS